MPEIMRAAAKKATRPKLSTTELRAVKQKHDLMMDNIDALLERYSDD